MHARAIHNVTQRIALDRLKQAAGLPLERSWLESRIIDRSRATHFAIVSNAALLAVKHTAGPDLSFLIRGMLLFPRMAPPISDRRLAHLALHPTFLNANIELTSRPDIQTRDEYLVSKDQEWRYSETPPRVLELESKQW